MLGSGVESVDLIVKQHGEKVFKQKSGDRVVLSALQGQKSAPLSAVNW
ncbi:hypothetical protein [uncultured Desulfobulbus sp.]|nr:hypothetical protein [uncultured Desulfobulbus sp.]